MAKSNGKPAVKKTAKKDLPKPSSDDLARVRRAMIYPRLHADLGDIRLEGVDEEGTKTYGVVLRYPNFRRKAIVKMHPCGFARVLMKPYGMPLRACVCRCGERLEDGAEVGTLCAGCIEVIEFFVVAAQLLSDERITNSDDVRKRAIVLLDEARDAVFEARALLRPLREFEEAAKRSVSEQWSCSELAVVACGIASGTSAVDSAAKWQALFAR